MYASGEATILHADLDSFYASVEQRDNPRLRGRPVIVGSGVVLAASYEAKAFGVRTPMPGRRARALCPDAVTVDPRFSAYTAASKAVFEIFRQTTPSVEGISVDEAFLDVSGLRRLVGPPEEIARNLRRQVREQVGLPITVGIARTKFLAKIASAAGKPDGLLVVPPDRELLFLHPLPVERLWGIGKQTAPRLHAAGLRTIGDLAAAGEAGLIAMLGPAAGTHLYALSQGIDHRPVVLGRRRHSIGSQQAMWPTMHDPAAVDESLIAIADRVTRRMRTAQRVGRTIVLRLRYGDYSRATRSKTLDRNTSQTDSVLGAARSLLQGVVPEIRRAGLTLVGISVGNLEDANTSQLELPFDRGRTDALDRAMDAVRGKFGSGAVTRAVLLGRGQHDMPMLPD